MIEYASFWKNLTDAFLGQAVVYFFIVGSLFLLFWKWFEQRLINYRIQIKKRVDAKQLRFEIRQSVVVLFIGALNSTILSLLYSGGYTKLTTDATSIGWFGIVFTVIALLILNDFWFYFWHRTLHHPKIFRYIHAVHHKSVDVNPFSSYSFHWIEGLILGIWIVPVVLVVPIYLPSLGFIQVVGMLNNLMSHLGYELFPPSLMRIPLIRWVNTSTFHNMHHTSLNGNYGLMTRLWDRFFHTELENYETTFMIRKRSASE